MEVGKITFNNNPPDIKLDTWEIPEIKHGVPTKYGYTVYYPGNLHIGKHVDIGWGCFLQARNGLIIRDDVQIGGGTYIYTHNTIDNTEGSVLIKEYVTIGAQSLILPNVVIGKGAIIGAQSLIKKDVPENARVTGVWA